MTRVLLLSTDLQRGGLPLRLAKLALRFRDAGLEPIVGCLAPPGPLSHDLAEQGVTTFSCEAAGAFDAFCLVRLFRQIKRFDPDLIHASLFHANLAARLVARCDRYRPLVTSTVTIEIERPIHRVLESLTWGWSDLHVANSEAVAAHLRDDLGMGGDRVVVIPNGIDFEEVRTTPAFSRATLGLSDHRPLIVWAGRMDPVKDLSTFVEAVSRVRRRVDAQAVLLGDGPERNRIEREIASRGLTQAIRLAGWSMEVFGWLKSADVLLFPSLTEGSPNTVIEAMACRCPVVASDIPSCRELIRDGLDGLLCTSQDAEAFATATIELLDNRAKGRRMAERAHERVLCQHDLVKVVGQWVELYRRLAG